MIWQVVFEPPAQAEIAAAFDWYEQRSYGLGGEFLRAVAAAEEQLARNPEMFPTSRGRFRRKFLRRFLTPCTSICWKAIAFRCSRACIIDAIPNDGLRNDAALVTRSDQADLRRHKSRSALKIMLPSL